MDSFLRIHEYEKWLVLKLRETEEEGVHASELCFSFNYLPVCAILTGLEITFCICLYVYLLHVSIFMTQCFNIRIF